LLKPTFKESVGKDELDLGHMVNNRVLGSLLFRSINGVGVAGREVHAVVGSNEGEGDRVLGKEMI
jgi:hypothetical protein